MRTISKGKRVKEASSDRWEVFYNENYACKMRGTESDRPNETAEFNSVQELLDFLEEEQILYWSDDEHWVDIYESNRLSDDSLDDIADACNQVDITGGDTIVFSIIHIKGNRVISERETGWDPAEFEFDEDDDDYYDEDEEE